MEGIPRSTFNSAIQPYSKLESSNQSFSFLMEQAQTQTHASTERSNTGCGVFYQADLPYDTTFLSRAHLTILLSQVHVEQELGMNSCCYRKGINHKATLKTPQITYSFWTLSTSENTQATGYACLYYSKPWCPCFSLHTWLLPASAGTVFTTAERRRRKHSAEWRSMCTAYAHLKAAVNACIHVQESL